MMAVPGAGVGRAGRAGCGGAAWPTVRRARDSAHGHLRRAAQVAVALAAAAGAGVACDPGVGDGRVGFPPGGTALPAARIPMTEVHTLRSTNVDAQAYQVRVALPVSYGSRPEARYPVLYVLDADLVFGTVTEVTRALPIAQELPEVIVVGIGYAVESFVATLGLRARDYTPTEDPVWMEESFGQAVLPGLPPPEGTGGGPAFLAFLAEELAPFIDGRYRTVPGDRGIFGDSLGGIFALYALFHRPEAFRRYIVGSPSLWWDDEVTFGHAERFLADREDLSARVFLGVGSLEEEPPADEFRMVSNVERLGEMMRSAGFPSLHVEWRVFDGETHMTVPPVLFTRGVRSVYPVDRPAG